MSGEGEADDQLFEIFCSIIAEMVLGALVLWYWTVKC
jgi:hypothetical protein